MDIDYSKCNIEGGVDFTEEDYETLEKADWTSVLEAFEKKEEELDSRINSLLSELENVEESTDATSLAAQCKDVVIDSILGPFGLTKAMFNDKIGGAVTTQHNASKGIFSKESEEYDRGEYVRDFDNSIAKARMVNGDGYTDEYTGLYTDTPDVDHIVAANDYHRNYGGWMQNKDERASFGADPNNHAVTDRSVNRSMGQKGIKEWEDLPNRNDPSVTNKEYYGLDDRRVNSRVARGEATAQQHAPTTGEKVGYYAKNLGIQSGTAALKLAARQAIGTALKIFVEESFTVIRDAIKKAKEGVIHGVKEFLAYIIEGIKAIKDKMSEILKRVGVSAAEGGISGAISTLVTFVVNSFITTAKRIVALIREVVTSVIQTIRVACDKSKSAEERKDAIQRILFNALNVCIGIFLTEAIVKFIQTTLTPLSGFADDIAKVLTAIVLGLLGVIIVYIIGRIHASAKHKRLMDSRHQSLLEIQHLSTELATVSNEKMNFQLANAWRIFDEAISEISEERRLIAENLTAEEQSGERIENSMSQNMEDICSLEEINSKINF